MPETKRYMSKGDIAELLGLKSARSLSGTLLPDPDVLVGPHPGWKRETVDAWREARPGRGRRGAR